MTFFRCETCQCCREGCPHTSAGCLKMTFDGFTASVPGCVECETLDTCSLILRRDETRPVSADVIITRASAAPPDSVNANIDATLKRDDDGSYFVESVEIVDGGTNYTACAEITLAPQGGFLKCRPAVFSFETGNAQPQLQATVGDNLSAILKVNLGQPEGSPPYQTWPVESVSVVFSGAEYADGQEVTFSATRGAELEQARAVIKTRRMAPQGWVSVLVNGNPALGVPAFEQIGTRPAWRISGVSYFYDFGPVMLGDPVTFLPSNTATEVIAARGTVSAINEYGWGVAVEIQDAGEYYLDTGEIESVEVTDGGKYISAGAIISVDILDPGRIIPEDPCRFTAKLCGLCTHTSGTIGDRILSAEIFFPEDGTATLRVLRSGPGGLDLRATITDWDGTLPLEFPPESFTLTSGCTTAGTITVDEASCEGEQSSCGDCDPLPDQITVTLKNYDILRWTTAPPGGLCPGGGVRNMQNWHCGQCQTSTTGNCSAREIGSLITFASGAWGWIDDGDYIFDRITPKYERPITQGDLNDPNNCNVIYRGLVNIAPFSSDGPGGINITCQEDATLPAEVRIAPVSCQPTAYIAGPQLTLADINARPPCLSFPPTYAASVVVGGVAAGSVTNVIVVTGGSGYAWRTYTKREPTDEELTVTIDSEDGHGAELTPVLEPFGVGPEGWAISDFIIDAPGEGYKDGDEVSIVLPEVNEDTLTCPLNSHVFAGTVITGKEPPEAELIPVHGEGADIEIVWQKKALQPACREEWEVKQVNILSPGTGYKMDGEYGFQLIDGTIKKTNPILVIKVTAPAAQASATIEHPGSAVLTVTLQEHTSIYTGRKHWTVQAANIVDGGSGYPDGLFILFAATVGEMKIAPVATITVDQNGTITGITITSMGRFESNFGPLESITVNPNFGADFRGGSFYKDTGTIACINITQGGRFASYEHTGVGVSVPAVRVESQCHTANAELQAVVNQDPESPDFGKVTSVNVINGGAGYAEDLMGWKLTLVGLGGHRTESPSPALGDNSLCFPQNNILPETSCRPTPATVGALQALGCPDVTNWFLLPSTRTTTNPCPNELLTRDYKMFYGASIPGTTNCQQGIDCKYGFFLGPFYWVVINPGSGDIECKIKPA